MDIPQILYEDNHVLAVGKQAGLLVQGDSSGDTCLLDCMKDFIKRRDSKPGNVFLGLPHRLDRPTSGVVVLAKTSRALSRLTSSFRDRDVEKIYWAVVSPAPSSVKDELVHWLKKDGKKNLSRVCRAETPGVKEAKLRYKVVGSTERYSLLEVELLTGRHHQIRAQLASIGCPIKGDLKYGAGRSNPGGGIHLHARRLELAHPTRNERLSITAPPPDESLWNALAQSRDPNE